MRVGILVSYIGNFGQKGFYNAQEIGLAKALSSISKEVVVYKLVSDDIECGVSRIDGTSNVVLQLLPSKKIGTNGIVNVRCLDCSLDLLVYFSDTQLSVPQVYKWAKQNNIELIPYIGVTKSHSNNLLKQGLINWLFTRNLRVYRKNSCMAKTPEVADHLMRLGVDNVQIAPVGLDFDLLKRDYETVKIQILKEKYGFQAENKVILFIGRMTEEKQPERMIRIFKQVWEKDSSFRLLMVGSGELSEQVSTCISENKLSENVKRIERIPNKDIWELYRLADCFVNLNQQEIYGMTILEAMYYGCEVIAWRAPGPNYIIDDGKTGYLVESNEEVCQKILTGNSIGNNAKESILTNFLWSRTADVICGLSIRK